MWAALVTEEEHNEFVQPRLLEVLGIVAIPRLTTRQRAAKRNARLLDALRDRNTLPSLQSPVIPWQIKAPVDNRVPSIPENKVGCRVVPKRVVDNMLGRKRSGHSPSYADVGKSSRENSTESSDISGWRMEGFICDQFITGTEGLVDKSRDFQTMTRLLSQKTSPISSALSITFDYEG